MLCNQILQIFQTISDPNNKTLCWMILKMILPPFLVSEIYIFVSGQILSYRVFFAGCKDYSSLFNVENNKD